MSICEPSHSHLFEKLQHIYSFTVRKNINEFNETIESVRKLITKLQYQISSAKLRIPILLKPEEHGENVFELTYDMFSHH